MNLPLLLLLTFVLLLFVPPIVGIPLLRRGKGQRRVTPLVVLRSMIALTVFTLTSLFVLIPLTFLLCGIGRRTERKQRRLHRLMQRTARLVVRFLPGVRFTMSNPTGETFERGAIIICNHQSMLDLMYIMSLTPKMVILTKDWVWRNAFFGYLVRRAEYYPVSAGMEINLPRLRRLVARGYSVMLFPEGTRSADGRIHRFHQGAFYLAEQLSLDILPIFLHGTGHALPKTDFMLYPGTVRLEVAPRIAPPGPGQRSVAETRSAVQRYYREHYEEICRQQETAAYRRRGLFRTEEGGEG